MKLKRIVSLMLVICMTMGLIPAQQLGLYLTTARAESEREAAQQEIAEAAIDGLERSFEEIAHLAAERLKTHEPQDDGEWQYVVLPELNYAVIVGHRDAGQAQIDLPAVLGGADVVALLSGVFAGHDALMSVTMDGNVYYAAKGALPRGVVVRGYNGSYAQSWAAENGHAFENLSQLDFVSGVVDCSDIDAANFTRHSETRVTLRALEANRLEEGSIFFLADPLNLYAISFYQVKHVGEAENGFVTFECITPDISMVLHSFTLENEIMMADWSTLTLYEGVELDEEAARKSAQGSNTDSYGFTLTPEFDLKNDRKLKFEIGYKSTHTVSAYYANLSLDTYTVTSEETFTIGGTFEVENAKYDEAEGSKSVSELAKEMIKAARTKKTPTKEKIDIDKPLCNVTLFSLWGIVSFTLETSVNIEFTGSIEVKYTYTTTTEHKYTDGTLKSTNLKKEESGSVKASAELKAGVTVSIKLYLFVVEIASIGVFAGLKGTAELEWKLTVAQEQTLEEAIAAGLLSLETLNMLDCIQIRVSVLVEMTAKLGNKYVELASYKATLLDWEILKLHHHFHPIKYVYKNGVIVLGLKSFSDYRHFADDCPLTDSVKLMIPSIDKVEPMGSQPLMGQEALSEPPVLELPDYGVRAKVWYEDKKLTEPINTWPYAIKSGEKIYGETEEISETKLIGFDGKSVVDQAGLPVTVYLAKGETVNTKSLDLKDADHIVGFAYVSNAINPVISGSVTAGKSIELTGDGKDHILLVIRDNDLKINFIDEKGADIGTLTTGHFIEVPESSTPDFPILYDPAYAVATYEWRGMDGKAYPFPQTFGAGVGAELELYMTPTGIERVYPKDDTATSMGGGSVDTSGLDTYKTADYFTYTASSNMVMITGFKAKQTYVDDEGMAHEWTAVPEVLSIPAYIDGLPVRAISGSAFKGLSALVSVKLPSTITSIGADAFSDCPKLKKIDLSACEELTAIPAGMAYNDTALVSVSIPSSVTKIGNEAFRKCSSLTSAVINADIGNYAFDGCTSLKSVTLRYQVTSIGAYAFRDCMALTSLTIPCSARTVGNYFIQGCTGLTALTFDGAPGEIKDSMLYIGQNSSLASLTLNLGVTKLGASMLTNGGYGFPSLTSISLPEALREVGQNALNGAAVEKLKVYDLGMLGTGFARNMTTLREIEFERGVISDYAFYNCTGLEKITMGAGVFAVGKYAFYGCTALKEVTLGNGVTSVGDYAFYSCKALESVSCEDGRLKTIGQYAFRDCTALVSVDLGDQLTTVGNYAFSGCVALEAALFPPTVKSFGTYVLSGCTGLKTLSVGGPATPVIGNINWLGMTSGSQLETLIIGEGVTEIGYRAFANLSDSYSVTRNYGGYRSLKQVTLPSTLEKIGDQAFLNATSLEAVALPTGLTSIGDYAFYNCSALRDVSYMGSSLATIGQYAFRYCASLETIGFGDGLVSVGQYAFDGCSALTAAIFPPTMQEMGNYALHGCSALKTLAVGGWDMPVIGGANWLGHWGLTSQLETLIINEGVTEIGYRAFANISGNDSLNSYNTGFRNLKSVTLPSTIKTIGDQAFANAVSLETIALPSGLVSIGSNAFYNCAALMNVSYEGSSLASIGEYAFRYCLALKSIGLGDGLVSVGDYAFEQCKALEAIHFPPTMEHFGNFVLHQCDGLKTLSVGGPATPVLGDRDWLGVCYNGSQLETLVINEGVTEIGYRAFANVQTNYSIAGAYGFRNLKSVSLPSTLEVIGDEAFGYATSLETISLPSGMTSIGVNAFYNCSALTSVHYEGASLKTIGAYAFRYCSALKSIGLGDGLKSVGDYAFEQCKALEAIAFPPTMEHFGSYVLHQCDSIKTLSVGGPATPVLGDNDWLGVCYNGPQLETLIIGEGVREIAARAFANVQTNYSIAGAYGFRNLKSVSLPSTLEVIGDEAFGYATSLETLSLPSGMTSIGVNAFYNCSALTSVHYEGDSLKTIGAYAFRYCAALKSIGLGDGLKSVGDYAFEQCKALEAIAFPPTMEHFGSYVLHQCDSIKTLSVGGPATPVLGDNDWLGVCYDGSQLETLIIGEGVMEIGYRAFANLPTSFSIGSTTGFKNLKRVSLPSTLEVIGDEAFAYAESLETLDLPSGMVSIGNSAFKNCSALTSVNYEGSSLISIGNDAFRNCTSVKRIDLGDGLKYVGSYVFDGCKALEVAIFPPTVNSFGGYVLNGCVGLKSLTIGGAGMPVLGNENWLGVSNGSQLETLIIGEGVTDIGYRAFANLPTNNTVSSNTGFKNLKRVSLPSTLKTIGREAFAYAISLESLTLPSGLVTLGSAAFSNCTGLLRVNYEGDSLESVKASAFTNCTALEHIDLGNGLLSVGNHAFNNCKSLQSIAFPPTVNSFGEYVLNGCSSLKTLTIGGAGMPVLGNENWLGISYNSQLETLIIGEGVTEIGYRAFANNTSGYSLSQGGFKNLKRVSLPSTLKTIGAQAFGYAASLESLSLPSGLVSIGDSAFEGCSGLTSVNYTGSSLESIGAYAFQSCASLRQIGLGEGLKSVGGYAFYGCKALEAIAFPPTVESFGIHVLYDCPGLKTLTIGGEGMPVLGNENWLGVSYNSQLETLIIGEGVTEIGYRAFANNTSGYSLSQGGFKNLMRVSLPGTLRTLGAQAFGYAISLKALDLPSDLVSIGEGALYGVPATLTSASYNAVIDAYAQSSGLTYTVDGQSAKTLTLLCGEETLLTASLLPGASLEMALSGAAPDDRDGLTFDGWYMDAACSVPFAQSVMPGFDLTLYAGMAKEESIGARKLTLMLGETVLCETYFASGADMERALAEGVPEDRDGLTFDGWYLDEALSLPFAEKQMPSFALTLYAGMAAKESVGAKKLTLMLGETVLGETYLSSGADMEDVLAQSVPADKNGKTFTGWYMDEALNLPFAQSAMPGFDLTLFAGMAVKETVGRKKLTLMMGETLLCEAYIAGGEAIGEILSVNVPADKGGKTFTGWYQDEACSLLFSKDTMPHFDLTLYAGMTQKEAVGTKKLTLIMGEETLYTGYVPYQADISALLSAAAPKDQGGKTFDAWYLDAELTVTPAGFAMPGFDLTLYAGMTPLYTVSFAALSGDTVLYETEISVGAGKVIPWPKEPAVSGYRFDGWYLDGAMSEALSAGALMPDGDLTVYGKLTAAGAGAVYSPVRGGVALRRYVLAEGESTDVWLPNTYNGKPVVAISADAFADARQITSLHLPDSLREIGAGALDGLDSLTALTTGPNSQHFTAVGGVLYTADMRTLVSYPKAKPAINLYVPEGVTAIAENACRGAKWLKKVVLGDSVTTLGSGAFADCAALVSFTAYGLEAIGEQAIPKLSRAMEVYGPIGGGVLRAYLHDEYNGQSYLTAAYNRYGVSLYLDGRLINAIAIEAGQTLPVDFLYGELENGKVIHTWFTDRAMTKAWNREDPMPAADLTLYAAATTVYQYEKAEFTVDSETVSGIRLTAYNGMGGALVLPRSIDGLPVMGIGPGFLAACRGAVSSVQIGSEVIEIADTAFDAPAAYPFGRAVKADAGSYAALWAERMGYLVGNGVYTLRFVTNSGAAIEPKTVAKGAYVRLPVPVKTGCTFAGWYTDQALTVPVIYEDGCFVMPNGDTTLYAAWEGESAAWDFTYEVQSGQIAITGYTGKAESLEIPAEIDGMSVTSVAAYAFSGNTTLKELILPDSVRRIGKYALSDSALEHVDLGGTKTIGMGALSGCAALTEITMDAAETIGERAFADCAALEEIHLPVGVSSIAADAFDGCSDLEAFTVEAGNSLFTAPDGVLVLSGVMIQRYPEGRRAKTYALPEGVNMIGEGAFRDAVSLTAIALPDNLSRIGKNAFAGMKKLVDFTMTDDMTVSQIPSGAFSGCEALSDVTLSSRVASIADSAFAGCTALERLVIPETVTDIGDAAIPAGANLTIYGRFGSAAQAYALEKRISFIDLGGVQATAIEIDGETQMTLGGVASLSAAVTPQEAEETCVITWESSDEGVVYVFEGAAYAVGVGTAIITATAQNGVSASKEFTVTAPAGRIVLSADQTLLFAGETQQLTAQIQPETAAQGAFVFVSDDETVVSIDQEGRMTALKPGVATITVSLAGCTSAMCRVFVLEEVKPSADNAVLCAGQTASVLVKGVSEEAKEALVWRSSDHSVVSVQDGRLDALSAGDAAVSCEIAGRTVFEVGVTVKDSMKTMKLPAALRTIEKEAFMGMKGMERIVLGGRTEQILSRAFAQMTALAQLEIPTCVASIAQDAFEGCGAVIVLCAKDSHAQAFCEDYEIPYLIAD